MRSHSRAPRRRSTALAAWTLGLGWVALSTPAGSEDWDLDEPRPAAHIAPERAPGADDVACAECHADVVGEWAASAHGLAWVDELYQEEISGRKRPELCTACHVPEPLLAGALPARPTARAADRHLGVGCDACHLGPDGIVLGATGAPTDAHPTGRSEHLAAPGSSALCATCHRTNIGPVLGVAKDFEASDQAGRGRSCVGCHMAAVERAAADGSPRVGRSHALQTPRDPAFLRRAFELGAEDVDGGTIVVVSNRAGHRVPGLRGREITITAEVLDEAGTVAGRGARTIDARAWLPVDGRVEIRVEARGPRVRVTGIHDEPRLPEPVRFLDEVLELPPR